MNYLPLPLNASREVLCIREFVAAVNSAVNHATDVCASGEVHNKVDFVAGLPTHCVPVYEAIREVVDEPGRTVTRRRRWPWQRRR